MDLYTVSQRQAATRALDRLVVTVRIAGADDAAPHGYLVATNPLGEILDDTDTVLDAVLDALIDGDDRWMIEPRPGMTSHVTVTDGDTVTFEYLPETDPEQAARDCITAGYAAATAARYRQSLHPSTARLDAVAAFIAEHADDLPSGFGERLADLLDGVRTAADTPPR